MSELGPEAQALVEQGRGMDGPPPGAKARIHDALKARIEAGPEPSGPGGGAGPWLGGAAALGVAAATVMLGPSASSDPDPRHLVEPDRSPPGAFRNVRLRAPSSSEAAANDPSPAGVTAQRSPGPAVEVEEQTAPADVAPSEDSTSNRGDLLAEARLMADAQRRLRDMDWAGALELARAHRSRFPDGMLVEERWGVMALARCGLGELTEGRELRKRLAERNPSSPMLPRIDSRCR